MKYRVIFHPNARANLIDLYVHFAEKAGPAVADRLVSALHAFCDGLAIFPMRGTCRDDLYPGLRTVGYKRRATITFKVSRKTRQVVIQGIYYGGQDFERHIDIDDDDL